MKGCNDSTLPFWTMNKHDLVYREGFGFSVFLIYSSSSEITGFSFPREKKFPESLLVMFHPFVLKKNSKVLVITLRFCQPFHSKGFSSWIFFIQRVFLLFAFVLCWFRLFLGGFGCLFGDFQLFSGIFFFVIFHGRRDVFWLLLELWNSINGGFRVTGKEEDGADVHCCNHVDVNPCLANRYCCKSSVASKGDNFRGVRCYLRIKR